MAQVKKYDVAVIGGGFYGCMIALFLRKFFKSVVIIEKEEELTTRASYNNQARVHNGYHYPRSFVTALRSHMNYERFMKDFKKAVKSNYTMTYAIAANLSKTTSRQFVKFCHQIDAPVNEAHNSIKRLFNSSLIENIFEVDEYVFDVGIIRKMLREQLDKQGIDLIFRTSVEKIVKNKSNIVCHLSNKKKIVAEQVLNCTYAGINTLLENSDLPLLPFKHEFIELPLIRVPQQLKKLAVTVLDGPFFGFLHFPDRKCHSLWHVSYAVRANWLNSTPQNIEGHLNKIRNTSKWNFMKKDIQRYIPLLENAKYLESLYEVKTVLMQNEVNDGRPILFRKDYGIPNFHVVMGGKIDNIYDMFEEMKVQFSLR